MPAKPASERSERLQHNMPEGHTLTSYLFPHISYLSTLQVFHRAWVVFPLSPSLFALSFLSKVSRPENETFPKKAKISYCNLKKSLYNENIN
jgi:hypothetical protein